MQPTSTIGKGGILDPCKGRGEGGGEDPENLEGWDLIEAKANILNKKLKFLHCAVKII